MSEAPIQVIPSIDTEQARRQIVAIGQAYDELGRILVERTIPAIERFATDPAVRKALRLPKRPLPRPWKVPR